MNIYKSINNLIENLYDSSLSKKPGNSIMKFPLGWHGVWVRIANLNGIMVHILSEINSSYNDNYHLSYGARCVLPHKAWNADTYEAERLCVAMYLVLGAANPIPCRR